MTKTLTKQKKERPAQELPGVPPKGKTKSELRAEEYCEALDIAATKKQKAADAQLDLIGQMEADGLQKVVCFDATDAKRAFTLKTLKKLTKAKC